MSKPESQWQPIETAPKTDKEVIVRDGPFTLAEAKDSRRPYRRQAWKGEWAENRWITAMDTGEHGCSYCDDTQPFLFFTFSDGTTAWVSDEDATACDYLLKPEGGE